MPNFTAADVKKLRDTTGAGMMDAKKALEESDGDFDGAVEALRIKGAAKAAKRAAERTTANGLVAAEGGAMIELACETDFVAKNADFQKLASDIASAAAVTMPADAAALNAATLPDGRTVADAVENANAVIGEKVEVRQVASFDGNVVTYLHRRSADLPAQVGVIVEYEGDDEAVARDIAMQVAAMRPQYVTRDDVPAEVVENERRIAEATAREEGKPEQALPKIIEGRVNGFYKDSVLVDQPSVKDSKKTVSAILEEAGVTVTRFARFEVGA
ncbi:elongation factor Ts [Actinobacteria bacterium YIM 96077]|uniref:Elongation factor Ts n=1 Tax=Phytoactinopolyspora halophila TaxID=1981511 RepID=A0A329QVL6_9ACTN|nr:translation elongation factor Ts [Phytoactinopolyspora halophila]AYY12746.1 elongation factor Ts [Actinobacteria bacterium YIM 96077]RAW16460.1 elongation factor Ts [Phytoactinopolyspora halophila]